ncbi:MAG: hypothetical protein JWM74_2342 [Myxococcaceae bacterium]|nr:hypothetical protein [Myxococcaceae bacterium]
MQHTSRVALRSLAAVSLASLVSLASCGPSTGPAKSGTASSLTPQKITAPQGVTIVSACTPSGPELCFNAADDNCNGVIDEGCGIGTGVLQFMIAWGDSPADVDLVVTDPAGVRVFEANRATSAGLRLDHDCPAEGCNGQNIENIFFEGMDPPRGRYLVEVKLADLKGAPSPVKVRFGARVGSRSYGADVPLSQGDDKKAFTFDL